MNDPSDPDDAGGSGDGDVEYGIDEWTDDAGGGSDGASTGPGTESTADQEDGAGTDAPVEADGGTETNGGTDGNPRQVDAYAYDESTAGDLEGATVQTPGESIFVSVAVGTALAFLLSRAIPVIGVGFGGLVGGHLRKDGRLSGTIVGAIAGGIQVILDLILVFLLDMGDFGGFLLPVLTGTRTGVDAAFTIIGALILAAFYFVLALIAGAVGGAIGGKRGGIVDQVLDAVRT